MTRSVRFGTTQVTLEQGDITRQTVDAVVNAANSGLRGGGGVDGAIHRAGGPQIMAELDVIRVRQGGCPTGQAVVTSAGNLKAGHVIHAVGPIWRGGNHGEPDLLRQAYRNSLQLAARHGAQTIAFPSISTGVYGFPIEKAAPIALDEARAFALANPAFAEIRFVLFSAADFAVYQTALTDLADNASRT